MTIYKLEIEERSLRNFSTPYPVVSFSTHLCELLFEHFHDVLLADNPTAQKLIRHQLFYAKYYLEMLGNACTAYIPEDVDCPISINELYIQMRSRENNFPDVKERITMNELGRLDPGLLLVMLEQLLHEARIAIDYENDLLPRDQRKKCYQMLSNVSNITSQVIIENLDIPAWDCHINQLRVQAKVEIHDGKPDIALFYMGEYEEGDNYDHFRFFL